VTSFIKELSFRWSDLDPNFHVRHNAYNGDTNHEVTTDKKNDQLLIAATANKERFIEFLVFHESGQTDYYTFC
jgi:hypothetical protein